MEENPLILLFTSDRRPRYIRDAENVLASPTGTVYRFRYSADYVESLLSEPWQADELVGTSVLIVFTVKHPKSFHPAYHVPVRFGSVVETQIQGSAYLIDFRLESYAPLPQDQGDFETAVPQFAAEVGKTDAGGPDSDMFACMAPNERPNQTWPHSSQSSSAQGWERVVEALYQTGRFMNHRFFRVVGVEVDGATVTAGANGNFSVASGKVATLRLAHHQAADITDIEWLSIAAADDSLMRSIGASSLEVSSRYDSNSFNFKTANVETNTTTQLTVGLQSDTPSATVKVGIEITNRKTPKVLGTIATAAGGVLLALPGVLPHGIELLEATSVILGAVVLGGLSYFGLKPLPIG